MTGGRSRPGGAPEPVNPDGRGRLIREWPSRNDPTFRLSADVADVNVGDRIHHWTVIAKGIRRGIRRSCGGYTTCLPNDPEFDPYMDCFPVGNYHAPTCERIPFTEYRFRLMCDCGTIKEREDPFMSRKCREHSANLARKEAV